MTKVYGTLIGMSIFFALGTAMAHAGPLVDKSEVGGMSCHQGQQNSKRCQGWGR